MPLLLTPLTIGFVVLLWTTGAEVSVIAGWSAVALMYFLFMAPTDCVVLDADRLRCRRPAGGLLRACEQQQHRRLLVRRFIRVQRGGGWWRSRGAECVSSARNLMTAFGAALSMTSGLFALIIRGLTAA
ncbi:MAG TPA: hypothetical protein VK891_03960 [Euzebyales bacterium]|nr:hypothetical protein [Euzebyales bacterium]